MTLLSIGNCEFCGSSKEPGTVHTCIKPFAPAKPMTRAEREGLVRMDPKTAEFKQRLAALLAEYGASITWTCSPCSDTHGIYDDALTIDIDNVEVLRTEQGAAWLDGATMADLIKP